MPISQEEADELRKKVKKSCDCCDDEGGGLVLLCYGDGKDKQRLIDYLKAIPTEYNHVTVKEAFPLEVCFSPHDQEIVAQYINKLVWWDYVRDRFTNLIKKIPSFILNRIPFRYRFIEMPEKTYKAFH